MSKPSLKGVGRAAWRHVSIDLIDEGFCLTEKARALLAAKARTVVPANKWEKIIVHRTCFDAYLVPVEHAQALLDEVIAFLDTAKADPELAETHLA